MGRILLQLAAVALGLSVTGFATARGDHGSNGGSKDSSAKSFSQKSSGKFNKSDKKSDKRDRDRDDKHSKFFDKDHFRWSKSCWCSRYGCNCYWYDDCWYVWYPRTCQYIPYAYFATFATPVIATTAVAPLVPGVSAPVPGPGPGPGPKQGP
jgi:hypothetical protein